MVLETLPNLVLVPGIFPPSRENWELIAWAWQFFPLVRCLPMLSHISGASTARNYLRLTDLQFTTIQWFTDFMPMGKSSISSKFNLPGKWAWFLMEIPGMLTVLYCMLAIPQDASSPLSSYREIPWANWTMAGMYTLHYIYRAVLCPLVLNPSMSPIHPIVFVSAFSWQVCNGLSLGGWLGGYGPTTVYDWAGRLYAIEIGMVLWGWSFMANIFHDDDLREIRRAAARRQRAQAEKDGKPVEGVEKLYMIPKNGLFHFILYPHYLTEWCEWAAFWLIGGSDCVPARSFLFNEIATMLPQAISGKKWYIEKFGKERIGNRKAIIPGIW